MLNKYSFFGVIAYRCLPYRSIPLNTELNMKKKKTTKYTAINLICIYLYISVIGNNILIDLCPYTF